MLGIVAFATSGDVGRDVSEVSQKTLFWTATGLLGAAIIIGLFFRFWDKRRANGSAATRYSPKQQPEEAQPASVPQKQSAWVEMA